MATSIQQVQEFLDEFDLRYRVDDERDAILIGFNLEPDETTYRDRDGEAHIGLVIRLLEEGDFLQVFAPWAWSVDGCPHAAAVFEAVAAIQGRYKMLRFDYDPADGELRPNVELTLDEAELSSRQFHRMMHVMMHGIQRFDGVIRHAMATGEVSFASVEDDDRGATQPPEIARLRRLAAEAGGIDGLERLACGEPADDGVIGPQSTVGAEADGPNDGRPAAPDPAAKPAIRRVWEFLFGPDDPPADARRRAG